MGFLGVDADATGGWKLHWSRALIKTDGRKVPLVVRQLCFAIQLWWELLPWVS